MRRQVESWLDERFAPVVATVVLLVGGMAHSLLGAARTKVGVHLLAPSDLWSLTSSASAIMHGHFAHIYANGSALTSPPAFEFALVPILWLGTAIGLAPHLQSGGEPLSLWLILGPASALMASSALFAVDAVARHWLCSRSTRIVLALAGAFGVGTVVFGWGHPEDCVALAFALWAALAMQKEGPGGRTRAAWLLGATVAFQPLGLLAVVPVLAAVSLRQLPALVARIAIPSAAVLALPLLTEPTETLHVIIRQPFQLRYVSRTPFTPLATHLGPGVLSGGPTRLAATVVGALIALAMCRRRPTLPVALAAMAIAFELRVLFEAELNWYYIWPVCALSVLLSARSGLARLVVCAAAMVATTFVSPHAAHAVMPWWPELLGLTLFMLVTASPWRMHQAEGVRVRPTPTPVG